MNCALILLAVISTAFAQSSSVSRALGSGPLPKLPTLVCSKGVLGPDARLGKALAPCQDPQVYGEGAGKINPNCAMWCMNKAFGLLDARTNLPTVAVYDKWVNENFPAEHKDVARKHFRECYERFGSKININDNSCKMAGAYNTCNWRVQPKLTC